MEKKTNSAACQVEATEATLDTIVKQLDNIGLETSSEDHDEEREVGRALNFSEWLNEFQEPKPLKYSIEVKNSLMYCPTAGCTTKLFGANLLLHDITCHPSSPKIFTCFMLRCCCKYQLFTKVELIEHLTMDHGLRVYYNNYGGVTVKLGRSQGLVGAPLSFRLLFVFAFDNTFFALFQRRQLIGDQSAIIFEVLQCSVGNEMSNRYKAKITFCGNEEFYSSFVGPVQKINTARDMDELGHPKNCLILSESVGCYGCKSLQVLILKDISSQNEGNDVQNPKKTRRFVN